MLFVAFALHSKIFIKLLRISGGITTALNNAI